MDTVSVEGDSDSSAKGACNGGSPSAEGQDEKQQMIKTNLEK